MNAVIQKDTYTSFPLVIMNSCVHVCLYDCLFVTTFPCHLRRFTRMISHPTLPQRLKY